jgi:hypothetical protein
MVVNVSRRMGTLLPSLASSSPSRFATMTATPIRAVAPPSAVLAPQGWATPVRPVVSSAPVALAPLTAAQSPSYGNALPGMPGYGDVPIVANSQPAATPAAGFYKYKQPTPASSAPISTDWSQTNVSPFANPLATATPGPSFDASSSSNTSSAPGGGLPLVQASAAPVASASQLMTLDQAKASGGPSPVVIAAGAAAVLLLGYGIYAAVR